MASHIVTVRLIGISIRRDVQRFKVWNMKTVYDDGGDHDVQVLHLDFSSLWDENLWASLTVKHTYKYWVLAKRVVKYWCLYSYTNPWLTCSALTRLAPPYQSQHTWMTRSSWRRDGQILCTHGSVNAWPFKTHFTQTKVPDDWKLCRRGSPPYPHILFIVCFVE